jgi:hypothetical protein
MKKLLSILLILTVFCFIVVPISAETDAQQTTEPTATEIVAENTPEPDATESTPKPEATESTTTPTSTEPLDSEIQEDTVVPAVEQLVNALFDGKVTVSQTLEYATLILLSIFTFLYNKYKKKLLLKEKAITKTDVEIEDMKKQQADLINQVALLGNILVSAYLSNNLIDPELKKKLATYAEELMKNTSLDTDKLTEKLILAAQNPEFKETIASIKQGIEKKSENAQLEISDIVKDANLLTEIITQPESEQTTSKEASNIIDNLKIGV